MMLSLPTKMHNIPIMVKTHDELRLLVAANVKRLRESRGLNQTQLANMINSYPSTINAIERGKKGLGKDLMIRICKALIVDTSEFNRPIDSFEPFPPPRGKIAVISMGKGGNGGHYEAPYPVGHGFDYIDRPSDLTDENAYAVKVVGDSMTPRYETGEIVVASPCQNVHSGDYVVAKLYTGEVMIKKIKFREGLIVLSSVNPAYEPWIYQPSEIIFFHKIVWKKEK